LIDNREQPANRFGCRLFPPHGFRIGGFFVSAVYRSARSITLPVRNILTQPGTATFTLSFSAFAPSALLLHAPWILALLSALLTCSLAVVYLWWIKRRQKEMQLGLQALAGMHWREFSVLVKRMLREQRGLRELIDPAEDAREPSSDFLLSDGPNQWLVSCKHGLAYRIGTAAVNELGAAARLAGAKGGVLLTEGRIERDGRGAAEKQAVEVLDGPRLWPLLQPYLPGDIEARVRASARHEALRRIAIAALGRSRWAAGRPGPAGPACGRGRAQAAPWCSAFGRACQPPRPAPSSRPAGRHRPAPPAPPRPTRAAIPTRMPPRWSASRPIWPAPWPASPASPAASG
jgi:hypothetical protein